VGAESATGVLDRRVALERILVSAGVESSSLGMFFFLAVFSYVLYLLISASHDRFVDSVFRHLISIQSSGEDC